MAVHSYPVVQLHRTRVVTDGRSSAPLHSSAPLPRKAMSEDESGFTPRRDAAFDRELDHQRRNQEQGELLKRYLDLLKQTRCHQSEAGRDKA